jgi:hypothetical protein
MPIASKVLMIRPIHFGYNAETAVNNAFQINKTDERTQEKALYEFDNFVHKLKEKGIEVLVVNDTPSPATPDSIFPNNWISLHSNGTICLYPMYAKNRRAERKPFVLSKIKSEFDIQKIEDFTGYEEQEMYLEGTGSMVLDSDHRIAFACISERTNAKVLEDFCVKMNYQPFTFHSYDQKGAPIYHTNVMMCVGDLFVVACIDSITDEEEKNMFIKLVQGLNKELITITYEQMNEFAGNMIQLQNKKGDKYLIMSQSAYKSLTEEQINELSRYNELLPIPLTTIETNGGGSARCMIAEVFTAQKS